MYLTRHLTADGPRWARDGALLPPGFRLDWWLALPRDSAGQLLVALPGGETASGPLLTPIEREQEIWASGVTYLRSRDARMEESTVNDIYQRVYDAARPEVFFKATGWRVVGPGGAIRVRRDSDWNVPEPELVLVFNHDGEIVGYSAGNDVSSRSIEGENPLYLPQAKTYDGSCALGPGIVVADVGEMASLPIRLTIRRGDRTIFDGETTTAAMKRSLTDLVACVTAELTFPYGGFLMTGTGIVPADPFSLRPGDEVDVSVGDLTLSNPVG